jgi:hypothetical protein
MLCEHSNEIFGPVKLWGPPTVQQALSNKALKYVSPETHWIAHRLAGKRIKTRPLSAVATIRTRPVSTSYYQLPVAATLHLRVQGSPAGKRLDYSPNLHEPCRPVQISAMPHSLQPRLRSSTNNDRSQPAAARFNTQSPRIIRPPQRTGNPTQISSADYPLAAH